MLLPSLSLFFFLLVVSPEIPMGPFIVYFCHPILAFPLLFIPLFATPPSNPPPLADYFRHQLSFPMALPPFLSPPHFVFPFLSYFLTLFPTSTPFLILDIRPSFPFFFLDPPQTTWSMLRASFPFDPKNNSPPTGVHLHFGFWFSDFSQNFFLNIIFLSKSRCFVIFTPVLSIPCNPSLYLSLPGLFLLHLKFPPLLTTGRTSMTVSLQRPPSLFTSAFQFWSRGLYGFSHFFPVFCTNKIRHLFP